MAIYARHGEGDDSVSAEEYNAQMVSIEALQAGTFTGTITATGAISGPRKVYTAPTSLAATDSGALCTFDTAAGMLYTLPAAATGLWFEFVVITTCTSGVHRVACTSGDFLLGTFIQSTDGTFVTAPHDANGTTHLAWEGNGTTTGAIKGDTLRVVAISGSQWHVDGRGAATGSEATPFVTS